jgi:16S rRNA (cytosine967-C5)-methyltransferase
MNARDVARRVLARVDEGSFATLALAGELARANLSDNDRGLATELVYGALKWRARLDRALAAFAPRGLGKLDGTVLNALRIAAHQILFLRVPAHAAVDDAVRAVKKVRGEKVAGFVNALLRRLARDGEPALPNEKDLVEFLTIAESAPRWLVDRALANFGAEEARAFLAALNAPSPTWLRANPLRATRDEVRTAIATERPRAIFSESPLADDALAVRAGGDLSSTSAFADGRCTVQDLGAQLVARLADPHPGERILDACAGVGGKSAHLATLAGDKAIIDAADLSPRKLELAADSARRLGLTSVKTLAADLTDGKQPALAEKYDRLILDAPCSGLGVLRRHPEAKWRPLDLAPLVQLQAKLLDALAPRVRDGGVLVYSVCTFTDEEGPRQIENFCARHPEFAVEKSLRTWPHRDDADAFFAIKLIRRAAA